MYHVTFTCDKLTRSFKDNLTTKKSEIFYILPSFSHI